MEAKKVMTSELQTVDPDASLQTAAASRARRLSQQGQFRANAPGTAFSRGSLFLPAESA